MSYTKVQFIAYRIYTGPGQIPSPYYVGCNAQFDDSASR
jgi:hypothetical protein